MAEYIEYHPLKFWLDPASIAEIVAHIQTYLVNNPINSTTEIETIIHDYLIAHPEIIGGVRSINGETGEVVLTADNISGGENVTIKDVLDSLQDQIDDIVASIPSDYQQLIDDVSNLKSALETTIDGTFLVYATEQGTTQNGNPAPSTTRIRTELIPIKAGYTVAFVAGTAISNIAIESYNTSGAFTGEQAWINTESIITATADGYWRFVYRKSNNETVIPSEYDAITQITITDYINEIVSSKLSADHTKNISNAFDSENVKDNVYVQYDNGRVTGLADWCAIQFSVIPGSKISTNVRGAHIAFFEMKNDLPSANAGTILSGYISGVTGILSGYSVPVIAKYATISIPISAKSTVQVEYGTTQTTYVPSVTGIDASKVIGLNAVETIEYNIYSDGTGDFANIRACLESINDSSALKHYTINIYPGTYDIASLYDDYSVSGLTIPDYVTLKGIGDKHNVVLSAVLASQNTVFSLLNIKNVCTIENMTLTSKNCRYTVHDDLQTVGHENNRVIKNCIFIGENCGYGSVYGSGLKGLSNWIFENCEFDATKSASNGTGGNAFSNHNNVNVSTPSFIKFINCRLLNGSDTYKTVRLMSMTNGSTNGTVTVTFEGCKIDGIYLGENDASQYGAGINYWVNGFGNNNSDGVTISSTDGIDYNKNVDLI